jgi:7-carboxy-7-deazaguanine synthase
MRVAEIYRSLQGEGLLTGTPSAFVRTSGCNLRCRFCDTPYASWQPEGDDLSVDEILEQLAAIETEHVVLTGGEPMLFAELIPLCSGLQALGRHITIETAGTLYLPVECDLMSISPKLSNSTPPFETAGAWTQRHEMARQAPGVVSRLVGHYEYQVKFVIDTPTDCQEVESFLAVFPQIDRARVLLMPQGTEAGTLACMAEWLEPYCHQSGLQFCPRRHIEWFGLVRGT